MKIKKLIRFLIIAILIFAVQSIVFMQKSNAAIESKFSNDRPHTSINVNNSFQYCYDMRYPTSSLGNNSLDPHLATARDWGGLAYLALSSYGAVKDSNGPAINISGFAHYTTTGNKTGVFNLGPIYAYGDYNVQTASYLENSTANTNNSKLYEATNSRLVDVLSETNDVSHTKGQAYAETSGWYSSATTYVDSGRAVGLRRGVVGYWAGGGGNNYSTQGSGQADGNTTYRPVIWN